MPELQQRNCAWCNRAFVATIGDKGGRPAMYDSASCKQQAHVARRERAIADAVAGIDTNTGFRGELPGWVDELRQRPAVA